MNYLVVGNHPWNRAIFDTRLRRMGGDWIYVSTPKELEQALDFSPRYIFFLHWSKIVPEEITDNFECVCFHPSPLPKGRGGTPIQNQIMEGIIETQLTAFRMTQELDAGPIYLQYPLSLKGPLHQIFAREMSVAADMVWTIIHRDVKPVPQEGEPTYFLRRRPFESIIGGAKDIYFLYDFIRMLDADGYPKATLDDGSCLYTFSDAELVGNKLVAKVEITCKK